MHEHLMNEETKNEKKNEKKNRSQSSTLCPVITLLLQHCTKCILLPKVGVVLVAAVDGRGGRNELNPGRYSE